MAKLNWFFGKNKNDTIVANVEEVYDDVEPDYERIDAELAAAKAEIARLHQAEKERASQPMPSDLGVVVSTNIINPEILPIGEDIPEECERSGKYRVVFKFQNTPQGTAKLSLHTIHRDSPVLDTQKPYIGPLCEHELEYLQSAPGLKHSTEYVFRVTPVVDKPRVAKKAVA